MGNIRHLKCNEEMTFKEQFLTKWREAYRKSIGVYEPLINISKLFGD